MRKYFIGLFFGVLLAVSVNLLADITLTTPEVIQPAVPEVSTSNVQIGQIIIDTVANNREVHVDVLNTADGNIVYHFDFNAISAVNNIVSQVETYLLAQGMIDGSQD